MARTPLSILFFSRWIPTWIRYSYIYRTWIVINLLGPPRVSSLFFSHPLFFLFFFFLTFPSPFFLSSSFHLSSFTARRRIELELWSSHSACLRPCNCEINHCHPPFFSLFLSLSVSHVRSILFFGTGEHALSSLYRRLSWQMVQFETPIVRGFFRFRWMDGWMDRYIPIVWKEETRRRKGLINARLISIIKRIFFHQLARTTSPPFNVLFSTFHSQSPSVQVLPPIRMITRYVLSMLVLRRTPPFTRPANVFRNSRAFFTRKGRVNFQ